MNSSAGVVFSPGPGHPKDYPHSLALYRKMLAHKPVLGVCLGHQIMLAAHGAALKQVADLPLHGHQVKLTQKAPSRFLGSHVLQGYFVLYNSWGVSARDKVFQKEFTLLSSANGIAQAAEHACYPHLSVQFHPESFASPQGEAILTSFLRLCYSC